MKRGFTLLELIVVIIIIGVLATLGLPKFFVVIEKSKMSEGIATLGMIRQAQLRYAGTEGEGNTTDKESKLGMEIGSSLKYFNKANISLVSIIVDTNVVANMTRKGSTLYGNYNLNITVGGNITCSEETGTACADLGF